MIRRTFVGVVGCSGHRGRVYNFVVILTILEIIQPSKKMLMSIAGEWVIMVYSPSGVSGIV